MSEETTTPEETTETTPEEGTEETPAEEITAE